MNFINKKTLTLILTFMFLFTPYTCVFASDVDYKVFDEENDIDLNKVWTITFNMTIDEKSLGANQIRVVKDGDGTVVDNPIPELQTDKVTVKLYPPAGGYKPDTEYTLLVENVQSQSGKLLFPPAKKRFTTQLVKKQIIKVKVTAAYTEDEMYILIAETDPLEATVTYQWILGDEQKDDFISIDGATEKIYITKESDYGKDIAVVAKGTGDYEGSSKMSKPFQIGTSKPTILKVNFTKDTLRDDVRVGDTLTVDVVMSDGKPAGDRVFYSYAVYDEMPSTEIGVIHETVGYIQPTGPQQNIITIPAEYTEHYSENSLSLVGKWVSVYVILKDSEGFAEEVAEVEDVGFINE